jgi:hypothetical protein
MINRCPALGVEFDWTFTPEQLRQAGVPEQRFLKTQAFLINQSTAAMLSYFRMAFLRLQMYKKK